MMMMIIIIIIIIAIIIVIVIINVSLFIALITVARAVNLNQTPKCSRTSCSASPREVLTTARTCNR